MRHHAWGLLIGWVLTLAACQGPPSIWLERWTDGDIDLPPITQDGDAEDPVATCRADTARCVGLRRIERCDVASLTWHPYRDCPDDTVCQTSGDWASCGACQTPPAGFLCCPDTLRCGSPFEVQLCDATGREWVPYRYCPAEKPCRDGLCTAQSDGDADDPSFCIPGSTSCVGTKIVARCTADGMGHEDAYPCADGYSCEEGQCREKQCVEPNYGCLLSGVPCCPGSVCTNEFYMEGVCSTPDPFCRTGEKSCIDAKTPVLCVGTGRLRIQLDPCAAGTSCVAGDCVKDTTHCAPGQLSCADSQTPQICELDDTQTPLPTCFAGLECNQGHCAPPGCPPTCPAGQSCEAGDTRCHPVDCSNPHHCGPLQPSCCLGYHCSATLHDLEGYCVIGEGEDNPSCTPGERFCLQDHPAICEIDGRTPAVLPACSTGTLCTNGHCHWPGCPEECPRENGHALFCNGSTNGDCCPFYCGSMFGPLEDCCPGYHCERWPALGWAICLENTPQPFCTPGAHSCSATGQPQTCESGGRYWIALPACETGAICLNGECVTPCPACAAGYHCDATSGGRCLPDSCVESWPCELGSPSMPCCAGLVCDWQYHACVLDCPDCPNGFVCDATTGGTCQPDPSCKNPSFCSGSATVCCAGFHCDSNSSPGYGLCQPDTTICQRGERSCGNAVTPVICNSSGSSRISLQACTVPELCQDGVCTYPGCPSACPSGQHCDATTAGLCQDDPSCQNLPVCGVSLPSCCPGSHCTDTFQSTTGTCQPDSDLPLCSPGARVCVGSNRAAVCAADGKTRAKLKACASGEFCFKGDCVTDSTCKDPIVCDFNMPCCPNSHCTQVVYGPFGYCVPR